MKTRALLKIFVLSGCFFATNLVEAQQTNFEINNQKIIGMWNWGAYLQEVADRAPEKSSKKEITQTALGFIKASNTEGAYDYLINEMDEAGDPSAMFIIGIFYQVGIYVDKNSAQSFVHMLTAADLGDRDAQYWVGRYYANGIGTDKDLSKALIYLTYASQKDEENATRMLKHMFIEGEYSPKILKKCSSVKQTKIKSQLQLAQKYAAGYVDETGKKINPNYEEAYKALDDIIPNCIVLKNQN